MKSDIRSIAVTISHDEGIVLRGQITQLMHAAHGGTIDLYTPEMRSTPLAKLYELLSGNFEASHKGVHFV
jgi:hypothetical protein